MADGDWWIRAGEPLIRHRLGPDGDRHGRRQARVHRPASVAARGGAGKSDPIYALAIARITAREEDLVPARCTDDTIEELRILSDYCRQLVTERIRRVNRVHADLVIVVPGYTDKVPSSPARPRSAPSVSVGKSGVRVELLRRLDRVRRSTGRPPCSRPASSTVSPKQAAP